MNKKNQIKKNLVVGLIIFFIIIAVSFSVTGDLFKNQSSYREISSLLKSCSNRNILHVGGSGSNNYSKIQDAISNASDGDEIFVYSYSSPYYENLVINKSIKLTGENRNTTKILGNGNGEVVYISSFILL